MNLTEYSWGNFTRGVGFKDIPICYDIYTSTVISLLRMGHLLADIDARSNLGVTFTIDWSKS